MMTWVTLVSENKRNGREINLPNENEKERIILVLMLLNFEKSTEVP